MVQNTLPDRNTGDAILVALSVANIVMLVSPVLLGLIAALQVLPESLRRHASIFFVGPDGAARDKTVVEREQSDDAPLEVDGWDSSDLPPLVSASAEHAAAAVDADMYTTHIELAGLNADALQLADVEAWQGNAMFGPGPSAVAPAAAGTFFPPTAADAGPVRASRPAPETSTSAGALNESLSLSATDGQVASASA